MGYKVSPVTAKDLYPFNNTGPPVQPTSSLNTWNGPIVGPVLGTYHMFNPIYAKGSLLKITAIMHGVATDISGPYDWFSRPQLKGGSNPAAVAFQDPADGNKTKFTLWQGEVLIADSPDGPFEAVPNSSYPGGNPAPVFHNSAWYLTSQRTKEVYTTPQLGQPWTKFADINVPVPSGMVSLQSPLGAPHVILLAVPP
jgi:hypothetical protein